MKSSRVLGPCLAPLALLALLALLAPSSAAGQETPRDPVVRLPEEVVWGEVQRPGAVYVILRSRPADERLDAKECFVREIVRSVQRDPF